MICRMEGLCAALVGSRPAGDPTPPQGFMTHKCSCRIVCHGISNGDAFGGRDHRSVMGRYGKVIARLW